MILEVEDLAAGYGSTRVLRGVSFSIEPGEVACVMGRNGAGKTTLLRALMGVIPKTGMVRLARDDISHRPGHRINAAGMVWVPQEATVFSGLTVRDHLVIAVSSPSERSEVFLPPASEASVGGSGPKGRGGQGRWRRRRRRGLGGVPRRGEGGRAEKGIEAAADLFPILGERLRQEAQTLSGGERKMLALASALIVKPKVVLMDEPTEGVAPVVVEQLIPAIAAATNESAVVLVEQNIDTALALGGNAYLLEQGSIAVTGTVRDLHDRGVLEQRLAL